MDTNVTTGVEVVSPVVANQNAEVAAEQAAAKRRGRPAKFVGDLRDKIVALLSNHTATETLAVLTAKNGKEKSIGKVEFARAETRRAVGLDDKVKITMPTLLKLAKVGGIHLRRGRPAKPVVSVEVSSAIPVSVDNPVIV